MIKTMKNSVYLRDNATFFNSVYFVKKNLRNVKKSGLET